MTMQVFLLPPIPTIKPTKMNGKPTNRRNLDPCKVSCKIKAGRKKIRKYQM